MPVPQEAAFWSICELGAALRRRDFSCVELAGFFLDRLDRLGPVLNAVVRVTRETALQEATRADRELNCGHDRGPLHGIPYGVKDLLATKGIPTSWGAAPLREQMIDEDATVIVRLREAGAVLCAKLAMVEIAGGLGYRQANASFTGPGLCPWDVKRWAGGSSSGPGSAVGGGLVPFAIGSETWGSIMTPACFCGISGLRPTYGRVSRYGAMALSWTMDKLGPMARTAKDCGLILAAIAGPDPLDPTSSSHSFIPSDRPPQAERFRLAVLRDAAKNVQPEVRQNYEASLELLRPAADIDEIELPDLPWGAVAATFINCECAAAFEGLINTGDIWEMTAEEDRWGIHASMVIPAKDYINAMRIRPILQRAMDDLLQRFDAIVTPTIATVAYPLDRDWSDYRGSFRSTAISDLGGAGNACGLPALSIPNGFGEDRLPTGLQFTGRAFSEDRLLWIAELLQSMTDWHKESPQLP